MKIPKLGLDSMCVISVMNLFIIRLDLMLKYSPRNYGIESTWSKTTLLFKFDQCLGPQRKTFPLCLPWVDFQISNTKQFHFTSAWLNFLRCGRPFDLLFFPFVESKCAFLVWKSAGTFTKQKMCEVVYDTSLPWASYPSTHSKECTWCQKAFRLNVIVHLRIKRKKVMSLTFLHIF